MKINYPIKYAIMPMVEQVGWTTGIYGLERDYGVVCYIVSKCYLVGEKIKYEQNGQKSVSYQVVFPYKPCETGIWNRWKRVTPKDSANDYSVSVDRIFNTFDAASEYCVEKNNDIRDRLTMYIPFSEDYAEKIEGILNEFESSLAKYKKLEELIRMNVQDMKVGRHKKLRDLIKVVDKNKGHMLSADLYKALEILDMFKYLVYSIKDEEYEQLCNLINNEEEYDVMSFIKESTPLLAHTKINGPIKVIDDPTMGEYFIKFGQLFYVAEGSEKKYSTKEFDKDTIILLTTETLEDIHESYKKHNDIEFSFIDDSIENKKDSVKSKK